MIALVDDEKNVRMAIRTALKKEGFEVCEYANGMEIHDALLAGLEPEIIVMDIMMPVMDGISCLRKMREQGIKTPVMFLTSRDEEFDKVLGLELGADDYLCKPFSMRELIARIRVLLRRYGNTDGTHSVLQGDGIELNMLSYTATCNGNKTDLTVTEFRLLEAFIKNRNIVLSREQLISICYPEDTYLNDRAIDCHIKRLRKKLSAAGITAEKIETVYGAGYKWI